MLILSETDFVKPAQVSEVTGGGVDCLPRRESSADWGKERRDKESVLRRHGS